MYRKPILYMGIFILFIVTSCALVYADGGYEVVVGPPQGNISPNGGAANGYELTVLPNSSESAATGGFDGNLTFWDLPLWIQFSIITGMIGGLFISVLAIIKIAPFIIGKIVDILENRNRKKIFVYVENNPGCTPAEISKNENLNIGTVKHHAGILERSTRITSLRIGKFVRLFKKSNDYSDMEKILASTIKNEMSRSILLAIRDNPGVTNSQLAEMVYITESTVHWHTSRFIKDGIVRSEKGTKWKKLYISDDVKLNMAKIGR